MQHREDDMNKGQYTIGVFISSMSIGEVIKDMGDTQKTTFHISYKSLEDSIDVGKEFQEKGVEVLISRRGTAHLLRENLHIPVLTFPQSSLSVLASLKKAKERLATEDERKLKIFMPNFRNETSGLEIVGELLDIEFSQGIYHDSTSLNRIVADASRQEFDCVVGGIATMGFAIKYGIYFQELSSTKEDIVETIENAKSAAQASREEKARSRRYQSIMDLASDGILSIDASGNISTLNKKTKELLNVTDNTITGKSIYDFMPSPTIRKYLKKKILIQDKIESINDDLFVYNQVPLTVESQTVGVVATLKEVTNVIRTENKVRRTLSKGFVARYVLEDLIYASPAMSKLDNTVRELAKTDSTVLIMGETGTGKEVVAQSIHNIGPRSRMPFVSVNCGAIPEQLLESELFGYEEGAFTGSKKGGKGGLFELAHQGTIFLDEIDSTSQSVQLRLLRVLQEKEVMRVGGDRKIPINVRVIAAAGKDLWTAVLNDTFRKDLFFRLNVLQITIPPLRERSEDIPPLLSHFLKHYSDKYSIAPLDLPSGYITKLISYTWPGNVRQLKHFAERIMLNSNFQQGTDFLDSLYNELSHITDRLEIKQAKADPEFQQPQESSLKLSNPALENNHILSALQRAEYSKSKAAELLGISRTTLWRKLKKIQKSPSS